MRALSLGGRAGLRACSISCRSYRRHASGDGRCWCLISTTVSSLVGMGEFGAQLIQGKVADMYTILQAGRSFLSVTYGENWTC